MDLSNFLGEHRHSEPKHLLGLKIFTMIILICGLTGYLAILIIDVNQDAPIIITSYDNVNGVRPPSMHFKSVYNTSIYICAEGYMVNNGDLLPVDCSKDIKQSYDEETKNYLTDYQPSKDVLFTKKSLYYIMLFFSINEEITPEKLWDMSLTAYDSENDLYYQDPNNGIDGSMNTYTLMPGQDYTFIYYHLVKEVIVPSWMNDFGVPPTYERKPYITSNLIASPSQTDKSGHLMNFMIQPKYINTIQVDREVRFNTYGGLGLIGGAWGLTATIYTFLFGANTLRPWGAVQSYCCGFSRLTQKKLKDSLPIIPFSDDSDIKDHQINSLSLAEQNKLLLTRLKSLELFLQEYVVDVQYLDRIRDNANKTNNAGERFNNQNTNSVSTTTLGTISSQQQTITISPNNLIQTSTTDSTPHHICNELLNNNNNANIID
ncbi:hypothetical protein RclHR1_00030017 [Rhizophagus clarus]|uniref:Uncharacterized protein n=1 Tax=Rhizophagus clarus TaxID=94130 RepID=A0A2Z6R5U6_9GLOM|nr:hypothetical protein RclHR1_00030017 [Rhizophagus clarus]